MTTTNWSPNKPGFAHRPAVQVSTSKHPGDSSGYLDHIRERPVDSSASSTCSDFKIKLPAEPQLLPAMNRNAVPSSDRSSAPRPLKESSQKVNSNVSTPTRAATCRQCGSRCGYGHNCVGESSKSRQPSSVAEAPLSWGSRGFAPSDSTPSYLKPPRPSRRSSVEPYGRAEVMGGTLVIIPEIRMAFTDGLYKPADITIRYEKTSDEKEIVFSEDASLRMRKALRIQGLEAQGNENAKQSSGASVLRSELGRTFYKYTGRNCPIRHADKESIHSALESSHSYLESDRSNYRPVFAPLKGEVSMRQIMIQLPEAIISRRDLYHEVHRQQSSRRGSVSSTITLEPENLGHMVESKTTIEEPLSRNSAKPNFDGKEEVRRDRNGRVRTARLVIRGAAARLLLKYAVFDIPFGSKAWVPNWEDWWITMCDLHSSNSIRLSDSDYEALRYLGVHIQRHEMFWISTTMNEERTIDLKKTEEFIDTIRFFWEARSDFHVKPRLLNDTREELGWLIKGGEMGKEKKETLCKYLRLTSFRGGLRPLLKLSIAAAEAEKQRCKKNMDQHKSFMFIDIYNVECALKNIDNAIYSETWKDNDQWDPETAMQIKISQSLKNLWKSKSDGKKSMNRQVCDMNDLGPGFDRSYSATQYSSQAGAGGIATTHDWGNGATTTSSDGAHPGQEILIYSTAPTGSEEPRSSDDTPKKTSQTNSPDSDETQITVPDAAKIAPFADLENLTKVLTAVSDSQNCEEEQILPTLALQPVPSVVESEMMGDAAQVAQLKRQQLKREREERQRNERERAEQEKQEREKEMEQRPILTPINTKRTSITKSVRFEAYPDPGTAEPKHTSTNSTLEASATDIFSSAKPEVRKASNASNASNAESISLLSRLNSFKFWKRQSSVDSAIDTSPSTSETSGTAKPSGDSGPANPSKDRKASKDSGYEEASPISRWNSLKFWERERRESKQVGDPEGLYDA